MNRACVYAFLMFCVMTSVSPAEPATVHFTGRVTSIDDPVSLLTAYQIGDAVQGFYTFLTERIDIDPDPAIGFYGTEIPPGVFSITIGTITIEGIGAVETMVWNDVGEDGILVQVSFDQAPPCDLGGAGFSLSDASGTALSSDANLSLPVLANYNVRDGLLVVGCQEAGGLSELHFEILSITDVAVPTVGAWGLAITALLLISAGVALSVLNPLTLNQFIDCRTGPGPSPPDRACTAELFSASDYDEDGDVDLRD